MKKHIVIINGPNINLLGKREVDIYGKIDYERMKKMIFNFAMQNGIDVGIFQTNSEGEFIDFLHSKKADAYIINPGAYSHYSIAIYDALKVLNKPIIEVHISNIFKREEKRKHLETAQAVDGVIVGLGTYGYILALKAIIDILVE